MLADPLSKPLQGELFRFLTSCTFGETRLMSQGRVGRYIPKTPEVRYTPNTHNGKNSGEKCKDLEQSINVVSCPK